MRFKLKILIYWLQILLLPKFRSRKAIDDFQKKRMNVFAKKILTKSKFYRAFMLNGQFDWQAVPQITKTEFMEAFDSINTCQISIDVAMKLALEAEVSRDFKNKINGITVGLSTGTSGKRALFLVSENERAWWVALVMARVMKPKFFKKQKVAFFLRANSNLYASVASNLFEFRYFDIFKPISGLLEELSDYSPDILAAQPSILMDIADAKRKKFVSICPIQLISFAEVLHQQDKECIESVFGVPITEVYQCTEGFLGVSCEYGTMHLNEDFIRFDKEWIDEDKFYPIITDFSRQSQPMVNYKLNDILQLRKTECACGSKLLAIEKIIGRDDDVLLLDNKKVFPDLIARRIAIATNAFQKYTIAQVGKNKLEVCLETEETEWEQARQAFEYALNNLLREQGILGTTLEFKSKLNTIQGNKLRKIKRDI
ncbi:MAG: adenylate synthase [Cytophagales bacterium]|nr:MAG: adenylate synthase [Cytophagales bacterium]